VKINFLQWNIWFKEPIPHITKFLSETGADIICVQELAINNPVQDIVNTPEYIADKIGFNFYAPEIFLRETDGRKISQANGIYSRYPITHSRRVWINEPSGSGGFDDEYRAYVEATLDLDGKAVTVGTTHMSYTHRFEETQRKHKEADALVSAFPLDRSKFIFAGDLNSTPSSYTVSKVSEYLKNGGPSFNENTWATKPFSYGGFEESELNWRLDYVFVSSDVKVVNSKILETDYSDHLPILTMVEI
jgi:endonuclease/exonuclease/phosphatase family metal-dependent hydrolase